MSDDYIEVDFYVCNVYRGKKKISRNSIVGMIFSENFGEALSKIKEMNEEFSQINNKEQVDQSNDY